ncbi:hypothetical protein PLESTB_001903200 [Pleodorina starrii]|uniref:SGNH domain-containing protein n=1 Tax=Pleodorina starrii TaxID=330485 RepID=A0A9W6C1Z1_9CHLO|nr:hypothetical protein PLESTB_001903200 [Pleodorina starrii]
MVSVGVLVDVQGAFPGWIALWPLASAAAIIVAGRTGSPFGSGWTGSSPRRRWGPVQGLGVAGAEQARLALTVAVSLAVVAVPVLSLQQVQDRRAAEVLAAADRNNPGAAALLPGFQYQGDPEAEAIRWSPATTTRNQGWVSEPWPGRARIADSYQQWCFDTVPNADPAATLMVIGNSHVHMGIPRDRELAKAKNWRVVTYIRVRCLPRDSGPDSPLDPVAGELAQVSMVDLGDLICPEGTCVPVIGNVYTYWDNNHLTVEYVRTLAPMFTQRVQEALTSDGAPY